MGQKKMGGRKAGWPMINRNNTLASPPDQAILARIFSAERLVDSLFAPLLDPS
jgi:hypothetical protein